MIVCVSVVLILLFQGGYDEDTAVLAAIAAYDGVYDVWNRQLAQEKMQQVTVTVASQHHH